MRFKRFAKKKTLGNAGRQHALLEVLKLPIDDRGRRRAAARAEWFAARTQPLDTGDILAELPR